MFSRKKIYLLFLLVSVLFSCKKSTELGSDLLDEDEIKLGFTDTFNLDGWSLKSDSVLSCYLSSSTSDSNYSFSYFLCGNYKDPLFGKISAEPCFQFRLNNSTGTDMQGGILDSVVLSIKYDSAHYYGKNSIPSTVEIYELATEALNYDTRYYTTQEINTTRLLGSLSNFLPSNTTSDSLKYKDSLGNVTSTEPPQMRIKLDSLFGQGFLDNATTIFSSNDELVKYFNGLKIKVSSEGDGMFSLNAFSAFSGFGNLIFYYRQTQADTVKKSYAISVVPSSMVHNTIKHDFTGSYAQNYISDSSKKDRLVVQGGAGTSIRIKLPKTFPHNKNVINHAQLELYIDEDIQGIGDYPAASQIVVSEVQADNTLKTLDDVYYASLNSALTTYFGGIISTKTINGKDYKVYKMNISTHLYKVMTGKASDVVQVSVYRTGETASRSVIYGPGSGDPSPKLKVAFSLY